VGGGYVRNWYGTPHDESDGGVSALLGLQYQLNDALHLRLGMDLDFTLHTASDSPFAFYHGNWGIQLGAGMRFGT
jgi:hypothetical protein